MTGFSTKTTRFAVFLAGGILVLALRAPCGEDRAPVNRVNSPPQPQAATPVVTSGGEDDFENRPLAFPTAARRASPRPAAREGSAYSFSAILPILFYVVVICALFTAVLWLAKRYVPGHRRLFSHPAMEVLGRTHLDQRRYVSLVRVGKRILVVGVSPDEITSLSEITDEVEITGILEVARPKSDAGLTLFQRLFQRHVIEAEQAETAAEVDDKAGELEAQLSSLRERVRTIREHEAANNRLDTIG